MPARLTGPEKEIDAQINLDRRGMPLIPTRGKAPRANRFDGILVKPKT
jgi:hypothetical protein